MSRRQGDCGPARRLTCRGLTLIEVLVVISLIAVLMSILLPSLDRAREEARRVYCMSNLKVIGSAVTSYLSENDNLPWTYLQADDKPYPGTKSFTSYSWGGMKAPMPRKDERNYDCALVPTELRPLNKFIDPSDIGMEGMKVVRCPSDRSAVSPDIADTGDPDVADESRLSSWQAYGSSYSINWLFTEDPSLNVRDGAEFVIDLMAYGKLFVQEAVGGSAAQMAVMWENRVDVLLINATDTGGGRLGQGWHRKYACHSFLFMDGHMEYGFFDTRFCRGPGWRTWIK